MDPFDIKKFLTENKLTRLSEEDNDWEFDLDADSDWSKASGEEFYKSLRVVFEWELDADGVIKGDMMNTKLDHKKLSNPDPEEWSGKKFDANVHGHGVISPMLNDLVPFNQLPVDLQGQLDRLEDKFNDEEAWMDEYDDDMDDFASYFEKWIEKSPKIMNKLKSMLYADDETNVLLAIDGRYTEVMINFPTMDDLNQQLKNSNLKFKYSKDDFSEEFYIMVEPAR